MDVIITILNVIGDIYIGFCFMFTTFFMYRFLIGLPAALDKAHTVEESPSSTSIKLVTVEVVADRIMMYDGIDHMFICQAATEDELWALAENIFPNSKLQQV